MLLYTNSPYFQKLFEGLPNGMMIFNANGNMYAVNEAALQLLGMERNECLEMTCTQLFSQFSGNSDFDGFVERFSDEQEDGPVDVTRHRGTEGTSYFSLTKSVLTEYGKAFGFMLSLSDNTRIHEMHAREIQIASENASLHKRHAKRLQQLSLGVAHQIRNPLMVISGFSNLLRKKNTDTDMDEFFEGIQDNTTRLAGIVESVAEYTSISKKSVSDVHLSALVQSVERQWKEDKNINPERTRFIIPDRDIVLNGDVETFVVAFGELFSNAHDFMQGTQVDIIVHGAMRSRSVQVTVTDNGIGIDEEVMQYACDPFFTTKPVGVGMGLCKVEKVMREHGGDISLEQNGHGGTTAILTFPVQG